MITVHTMGVHYRWQLPQCLGRQLRFAHDLREDLVSLQLVCDEDLRAIWSSYPAVAAAEKEVAEAEELAANVAEAIKAERIRLRSKKVGEDLASSQRTARSALTSARQRRREAIAAVKDEAASRRTDRLGRLRADQKALYTQYCQEDDLYWATFNSVFNRHATSVKRINSARAQGRPATLRHHRYDGIGTIAVQLQRQAGMPPRSPALLADPDGTYRNVLHIPRPDPAAWQAMSRARRRQAGRITVRMRCGSADGQPEWIELPVQAHRWLPEDADITGAELTITRTAGQQSARLAVTARVGEPDPVGSGRPTVAVHLGWRPVDSGTAVATWRTDQPITIPPDLREVMTPDPDGLTGRVVMPAAISRRLDRAADTASTRDLSLDAIRAKVADWLDEHGPLPYRDGQLTGADVRRWRSPARLAALATAWQEDPPGEIAGALWAWHRADWKLWHHQEHGRRRALGHRDDLYRQVAAILAQCGRVVVDDMNISTLATRAAQRSPLPTDTQTKIDRRRDHAAPGRLREAIVAAAQCDGVAIEVIPAAGLSRTHARCGHTNPADDRYMHRIVVCDGCGASYDQDASATMLMLHAATRHGDNDLEQSQRSG